MNNDKNSSGTTSLKAQEKPADPCILVIFGIGPVSRKLRPAATTVH
jgi:hypothetical protein